MIRLNFGSGPDLLEGFVNVDKEDRGQPVAYQLDILANWPFDDNMFGFILVNHVLCTMDYWQVKTALKELYRTLAPSGKIQVIDMNLIKAFHAWQEKNGDSIPIDGELTISQKLCLHVSGYGTRKSLYTPEVMALTLEEAGFKNPKYRKFSEYDTRPNESLVVEAKK